MTKEKFLYGLNACAVTYHNGQKFYEHDKLIKCFEDLGIFEQEPCDTVSRGVFEQVMWERDVAIEQLKELGYGLGEKPRTGHWKFVQRGKFIDICCSKCGYVRVKDYAYNYTVNQISEQDIKDFFSNSNMNFCEKCGAKMEESRGEK